MKKGLKNQVTGKVYEITRETKTQYTLLTVTFRDPIVRSLAMRAAADHGEGGWTCNTAADIIRWFEEDYGESLTDHGLDVKYEDA